MPTESADILIVSQCYWPEPTGSAPVMDGLGLWLAGRGHRVTVLTARPSYPFHRVFEDWRHGARDHEARDTVRIERVPGWPSPGGRFLGRLRHEARLLAGQLWALLTGRVARSDHVISCSPSLLMALVGLVARRRGGRHLCLVHDIQSGLAEALDLGGGRGGLGLLRWLERHVLGACDMLVTLSDEMRDRLQEAGIRRPILVLPPQVDTAAIRPLPRPPTSPPTVLYSGNLGHKQGLGLVLDMARPLAQRMPEARVIIRGSGNALPELQDRLRRDGLTTVSIEPLAPLDRLAEALAEGDVHLIPQRPEGADFAVPSKAFAIMAAGRPFVATAGPGAPLDRLARDSGAGSIVPPGDADAFAQAVADLLTDRERAAQMGARGRAWVEAHAAPDVVLAPLEAALLHPSREPVAACDPPSEMAPPARTSEPARSKEPAS